MVLIFSVIQINCSVLHHNGEYSKHNSLSTLKARKKWVNPSESAFTQALTVFLPHSQNFTQNGHTGEMVVGGTATVYLNLVTSYVREAPMALD